MFSAGYTSDSAAALVGVALEDVGPGYAKVGLVIEEKHLNGLGTAHGGIIFLLADTAFAYACNSRGVQTVASSCHINYNAAVRPGDVLTAIAEEKYLSGRNGIYDVLVVNQENVTVAHFRGNSVALKPATV
jgi:acyl-CoA thioesterase